MCSVKEEERNWVLRAACTWLVGMVTLIAAGRKACPICSQSMQHSHHPQCAPSAGGVLISRAGGCPLLSHMLLGAHK